MPTRRKDYWFCNLADGSEASPVVTRQVPMCDRQAKLLRMEEVTRLGKMLGIKGHSTACPSGSLSSTVVVCI